MSAEDNLHTYFRTIWKDTEGVVYLPSRGADPNDWKQSVFNWPQDEARIVQMVLTRKGDREVYVNPTLYKEKKFRDDGKIDGRATLARSNVLGSWTLWADFDGNAPDSWGFNDAGGDYPPSLRIQTSSPTNQHTYWVLTEFQTDPTIIEDKNRALAHQLKADTSGWDISQLLRPPSTINHGYGKDDRRGRKYEVSIEESSDRTYPASIVQRESVYRPTVAEIRPEDIPSIRSVLAQGTWSADFLNLFEKMDPSDRSGALARLGYYAAEAGFNDSAVYAVLDDADSRWGKYRDRTDRVRRLVDLVDRARRKYPYGSKEIEFSQHFGDVAEVEDAPKIVFNFQEFMDAEVHVEWILENLFPRKGYGIIYGMPGVGKTLIGMDFANCLVFGEDWMVWRNVAGPLSVLFLSLEMNHPTLKLQYQRMTQSFSETRKQALQERLFIAPIAATIPLDEPDGRQMVETLIMQHRPNVLFIDSLSESSFKTLNDDEGVRSLNRFFKYIREKYECSIFVIHHDRKSGATKHADLDSMWGSRFLSSATDFVMFLEKTDDDSDQIWLINDKNRLGTTEPRFLIDRDWNTFTFTHAGTEWDDPKDAIISALNRNGTPGGRSAKPTKPGTNFFSDFDRHGN